MSSIFRRFLAAAAFATRPDRRAFLARVSGIDDENPVQDVEAPYRRDMLASDPDSRDRSQHRWMTLVVILLVIVPLQVCGAFLAFDGHAVEGAGLLMAVSSGAVRYLPHLRPDSPAGPPD